MKITADTFISLLSKMEDSGFEFFISGKKSTMLAAFGSWLESSEENVSYYLNGDRYKIRRTITNRYSVKKY